MGVSHQTDHLAGTAAYAPQRLRSGEEEDIKAGTLLFTLPHYFFWRGHSPSCVVLVTDSGSRLRGSSPIALVTLS
ncbi:hypothetical protein TNCV_4702881 [Trichonephila clavipes]|nr:hypothetical protein TNCV_4702881 [Trichonephila clavipes]